MKFTLLKVTSMIILLSISSFIVADSSVTTSSTTQVTTSTSTTSSTTTSSSTSSSSTTSSTSTTTVKSLIAKRHNEYKLKLKVEGYTEPNFGGKKTLFDITSGSLHQYEKKAGDFEAPIISMKVPKGWQVKITSYIKSGGKNVVYGTYKTTFDLCEYKVNYSGDMTFELGLYHTSAFSVMELIPNFYSILLEIEELEINKTKNSNELTKCSNQVTKYSAQNFLLFPQSRCQK